MFFGKGSPLGLPLPFPFGPVPTRAFPKIIKSRLFKTLPFMLYSPSCRLETAHFCKARETGLSYQIIPKYPYRRDSL